MAYGFDEGKNKVNFADYFTYVIDSQAKFDDWVNGVSGNDYSYVAIIGGKGSGENGAYVQTISNNLTDKTKGIQGFCGARIEVNSIRDNLDVLSYYSRPTSNDYFVRDLTVNVRGGVKVCHSFSLCANLTNCTGIVSSTRVSSSGLVIGGAFSLCANLTNCTGIATGTSSNAEFYGFYKCNRLFFCTATGKTAKYKLCYASNEDNVSYIIPENGSDTPNGGFNV